MKGPSIWRFIRALKDEQKPTDIVFGADNRGVSVHLKRKKSRINRLKRDCNGGARNLNEYWDAMTHVVRSVM